MSQKLTAQAVKDALSQVVDRHSGRDVVTAGLISGIVVRDGKVGFVITVSPDAKSEAESLRESCEKQVRALPGVTSVTAVLTAHNQEPIAPKPQSGYGQPRERATWNLTPIDHVRRVIAVASGKGGAGKSTTTVNLALALRDSGQRTGILDADIYGPSIPHMLHLSGQPEIAGNRMQPLIGHGLACMSMGFITGDEAAILRGPMISKALHQMLRMTQWATEEAPLDTLLVDMPPGTGDIHLSMAQQVPLSGAIIVTMPQSVSLIDARKCLTMFRKVNVPILGVIENMSGGMFGSGGGKALADENHVPYLGAVPMDAGICEAAEAGRAYNGPCRDAYLSLARKLPITRI